MQQNLDPGGSEFAAGRQDVVDKCSDWLTSLGSVDGGSLEHACSARREGKLSRAGSQSGKGSC